MKKELLIKSIRYEALDTTRKIKKALVACFILISLNFPAAGQDCKDYGNGNAVNIDFYVNGVLVPALQGNVSGGDEVKICFDVSKRSSATIFRLVSYSIPGPDSRQAIYDADTDMISGGGTGCLSIEVPACNFELDFMRGCSVTHSDAGGSRSSYGTQGSLITKVSGGNAPCTYGKEEASAPETNAGTNEGEKAPSALSFAELPDLNIRVYPNPSAGEHFSLSFEIDQPQDAEVTISDILGNVVYIERLPHFKGNYQRIISMEGKAKGLYFAKVRIGNYSQAKRITVN